MPSAAPCMSASYVKPRHFAVCSSVPRASVSLPLQNAMLSSSMAARNSSSRANGAVSRRKRRGCGFRCFVRQIDPVFTRLDHGALGVFVPRHFPPFLCDFRRLSFSPFEGLGRSQRTLNSLLESRAVPDRSRMPKPSVRSASARSSSTLTICALSAHVTPRERECFLPAFSPRRP